MAAALSPVCPQLLAVKGALPAPFRHQGNGEQGGSCRGAQRAQTPCRPAVPPPGSGIQEELRALHGANGGRRRSGGFFWLEIMLPPWKNNFFFFFSMQYSFATLKAKQLASRENSCL